MDSTECARIIVQSDWDQAVRENNGRAWVAFRKPGQTSIYGELRSHGISSSGDPFISANEGFQVEGVSTKKITISHPDGRGETKCIFQAPNFSYSSIHEQKRKITCMDVTTGGLAVSCDSNQKMKIWTTNNGEIRRELEGHLGEVYTCRFFPSGVVVLSGGEDMQLKIWSAETGQCAATLKGHHGGITDTAIIDRGRNVLSASRDGTVKLWDCGKSACITTFSEIEGGLVNTCSIGVPDEDVDLGLPDHPPNEREVGTDAKLLVVGCENGSLQGYGLKSRQKVFGVQCDDAINCCYFVEPTLLVAGTQAGTLHVYDTRNMIGPLYEKKENRGAILSLHPMPEGCFISSGDGSCFFVNECYDTMLELTGSDCDPVYKIAYDGRFVYTCCRDSVVRRYKFP